MQNSTQTVRKPEEIISVTNGRESIQRVPLMGYKPRRTTEFPYVSEYRKNAIMTIPYGEDNFEFSFSVRKGIALKRMMENGAFDKLLEMAMKMQEKIDARETDIIQI